MAGIDRIEQGNSLYDVAPPHGSVTIAPTQWSGNNVTLSVADGAVIGRIDATSTVLVAPDTASAAEWLNSGVKATAQGAGSLTLTCTTAPTESVTVLITVLN